MKKIVLFVTSIAIIIMLSMTSFAAMTEYGMVDMAQTGNNSECSYQLHILEQDNVKTLHTAKKAASLLRGKIVLATKISTGTHYVLNTNTKKFHKPSCSSVNQMKEKNRSDVTDTRANIIARGYKACKKCKP